MTSIAGSVAVAAQHAGDHVVRQRGGIGEVGEGALAQVDRDEAFQELGGLGALDGDAGLVVAHVEEWRRVPVPASAGTPRPSGPRTHHFSGSTRISRRSSGAREARPERGVPRQPSADASSPLTSPKVCGPAGDLPGAGAGQGREADAGAALGHRAGEGRGALSHACARHLGSKKCGDTTRTDHVTGRRPGLAATIVLPFHSSSPPATKPRPTQPSVGLSAIELTWPRPWPVRSPSGSRIEPARKRAPCSTGTRPTRRGRSGRTRSGRPASARPT